MRFYAALSLSLFLLVASHQAFENAQAQYNLSVDEMMDRRMSGVPILDPKLELLINDVERANFRAVEFHNEKFVPEVKKYLLLPLEATWLHQHASMAARWTAWDEGRHEWFRKKKVEASSSVAVSGGPKRVRDISTIEVQNKTLLWWRSVLVGAGQLEENKGAIEGLGDLGDLWSEFLARLDKLDKAINALRKY